MHASQNRFQDFLYRNKQTNYTPQHTNTSGNTSANPNFFPHRNQCFKCLNDGHSARYCNSQAFCPYHGIPGHCFVECKDFAHLAMKLLNRMGHKAQSALSYLTSNAADVSFFGVAAAISAEELQDSADLE